MQYLMHAKPSDIDQMGGMGRDGWAASDNTDVSFKVVIVVGMLNPMKKMVKVISLNTNLLNPTATAANTTPTATT